jgi:hypothetical protein
VAGLRIEHAKRRYRVLRPVTVHVEEGAFGFGEEFDHQFTPDDEWENVDSGLLGLIPESYVVIGDAAIEVNMVEAPASLQRRTVQPGDTFLAAIPLAREEQLRFHIRRVPPAEPANPSKE